MKIYAVKILDISQQKLDRLMMIISTERKYKIEKLINKKDKIRALIADIMVRNIITQELGIKNKNIIIEKNQYGKPYLKEYEKLNFNISHSGDFVVCVIDDMRVGIDIEEKKFINYEEIAKRFFTVNELDYIFGNGSDTELSNFYEIWTLKESYVKYCGQGLAIPLKSFSMDIDKNGNAKVITENKNKNCIFKRFDINSDYKMAICSENKEITNSIITIDQNSLINDFKRFTMDNS